MDESLTPTEDETSHDHPSFEEMNNMFKSVIRCGSMATTIYHDEMATHYRGVGSSS